MNRNDTKRMKKMIQNRNQNINQQQMSLPENVMGLPDIKCVNCGETKFIQVFSLKYMSALVSPQGKEGVVHIGNFVCSECGHMFNPQEYIQKTQEQQKDLLSNQNRIRIPAL